MIKIVKGDPPQVLIDNQAKWTKDLLDAVSLHNGYSNIPESVKKDLLVHYRHKDIKNPLFASSYFKCAFCESKPGESGNIEIEHFEPKSLYPELAFEWDNLLPSCRKCNESKLDSDTRLTPIINPSKEDPETLLTYKLLEMCPIEGTSQEIKAQNTIEICDLNNHRLLNARSQIMIAITEYMDELREKMGLIIEADTDLKKKRRITKLRNSLEKLDDLLKDENAYASYCRWLISQYPEYEDAKGIVNSK